MADKMWDILRFLKNPEGEQSVTDSAQQEAKMEKSQIDAQLMSALERTEAAIDEELTRSSDQPPAAADSEAQANSASIDIFVPDAPAPTEADGLGVSADGADDIVDEATPEDDKLPEPTSETPSTVEAAPAWSGESDEERLLKIPISSIMPNPFQPRKIMGENEITELSESIKELGVLQPILVKQLESGYELIAGERRLRAAQRAGLQEIPAMVVETDPLTQQIIALVENIQRKNLSAIEEALCLQDIISKTGWSQIELSRRTGRSQASIANKLRLLRLDPSVQELVVAGKLGERQARSLLSLSVDEQKLLAQKAVDEDLSARALEALSETWNGRSSTPKKSAKQRQESAEGPAGELLGDIATLINRHRSKGISAQWKVKQMNQSSLVVEISVDLLDGASTNTDGGDC